MCNIILKANSSFLYFGKNRLEKSLFLVKKVCMFYSFYVVNVLIISSNMLCVLCIFSCMLFIILDK